MKPERWQQVEQLCHAALERKESEQATFLRIASAGDDALLCEVESLLVHQKQADRFIETPALEMAAKALAESGEESLPSREPPRWIGRTISHYRIEQELGSGGMGEVYRAVRDDQQYQKQVAIKLVRSGFDTEFIAKGPNPSSKPLATLPVSEKRSRAITSIPRAVAAASA